VPKGARLKGKTILQPNALRVLLSTDTRVIRGRVEVDPNIHAYRVAVMTGLRPGELMGLRVGDVEGNRLHVRRAINRRDEVTNGKNENALRVIVLHPLAAAEVRAQMQQLTLECGALREEDPLFPMKNQQSLYNYWQLYQRCNGIEPRVSLYELRHTFVSLIADSVAPAELRRMVGHSKSMDTLGWYSHAVDGEESKTALAVSGAFSEVLQPEK
jgi:integrase